MTRHIGLYIACILIMGTPALAIENLGTQGNRKPTQDAAHLTGSFSADLAGTMLQDMPVEKPLLVPTVERKKPFIAGFASLVVPGAGEAYVGEYTKGAIFLLAEVTGITAGILYKNKGDRRTVEFQNYAEAHWSVKKYAQYLNTYAGKYRADKKNATIDITASREVMWSQINTYEEGPWSEGFSHRLPKYGEQQYYELIGKYNQFKFGWDTYIHDANGLPLEDSGYNNEVPQQLLDYAAVRGTANDFYSASRLAISLVVVNHLLSAVDAYLSARHFNTEVSSHISMDMQRQGDRLVVVPQLSVSVGL